jgi:hypothetical protein
MLWDLDEGKKWLKKGLAKLWAHFPKGRMVISCAKSENFPFLAICFVLANVPRNCKGTWQRHFPTLCLGKTGRCPVENFPKKI